MQVIMINISQTANNLSRAFQKFEGSTDKLLYEEFEFARTFKYISFGTKYMLNGTLVANFKIALSIVFFVAQFNEYELSLNKKHSSLNWIVDVSNPKKSVFTSSTHHCHHHY